MPVALYIADSLIKVLTGFAMGFVVRDYTARKGAVKRKGIKKTTAAAKALNPVPRPREELKMVLCVNESLKMGKGKIGAQCAHAAVGVLQSSQRTQGVALRQWEMCGQPKIALRINNEEEMDDLAEKATAAGLPAYIVCDAGRTQIAAGSQTVLAVGPAPKSAVDAVTGHLKLL
mmetsp:Transcript_24869/g.67716  ORF Transcript_24869/g.67716 Transcript_24869/m.67716 type:complete len:174 (-) Transcript_24869:701-1222(-)|eukprot:CAMPEP_0202408718 /NCGR_PEP_ID=MMETSP1128-20130828/15415_1 /ASSEMBLY_ACC=CAM_ASM_000463 /TAXON_ID=3047 /ORGANISM="Dunaliella tertiolecta, Strain CCMP1320" /LENGTH=173 /DNA_ID=CAMNT_0049013925 /DNA_START=146 /DNA_END=667 /DNA_ORIENTATION=+